ncbi:MAG: hypothetical protein LQ341_000039 [Variospora aurantia]|nr:MAG: hypothetical protein LQ341_000039 [Variospora aurantia]
MTLRPLLASRFSSQPALMQRLLLRPRPPCPQCSLSSASRRWAAKQAKPPSRSSQYTPKPTRIPSSVTYKSFAQTLASRSEPTLLYQGTSTTIYRLGCYTVGLLCFSWSLHATFQMYSYPPSFMNRFMKSLYYGLCGLAVGMAALFLMRPYRIIQSVQALPVTSHKGTLTLHLKLESAPLFPGIKPRTVSVPAGSVTLSDRLYANKSGGVPLHVQELRSKRAEKIMKLKSGNLMSLPIRQLGFHLWNGFQMLKEVFRSSPFIYLRAKGYQGTWKLDKGSGWALDEGRAFDRVVKDNAT